MPLNANVPYIPFPFVGKLQGHLLPRRRSDGRRGRVRAVRRRDRGCPLPQRDPRGGQGGEAAAGRQGAARGRFQREAGLQAGGHGPQSG